jgi:hypothetical protein
VSDVPRRLFPLAASSASSALSAAALSAAIRSASMAAASASGISGMVSREDMLGLRDRRLVGVDGTDDVEEEYPGKASLNFEPRTTGDEWIEEGLLAG